MTKAEIINRVAERTGMSRKDAIVALEIFLGSIKDALKRGEKISLVGFGTFYLKQKRARNGRNIEVVGHVNPLGNPAVVTLKHDRIEHWTKNGAQPSDTVKRLVEKNPAAPAVA